jgi:hypothetical protein
MSETINVTAQLLTGERVAVTTDGSGALLGVGSSVDFYSPKATRAFTSGPLGHMDIACTRILPAEISSRTVYDTFELRIAHGLDGRNTFGALRGERFELMTSFGGPALDESVVRAAFEQFRITETSDGYIVQPAASLGPTAIGSDATLVFEGRGIIQVFAGDSAAKAAPDWAGTKTENGELWRVDDPAGGNPQFVAAFKDAVAHVFPASQGNWKTPDWADWIDALKLELA